MARMLATARPTQRNGFLAAFEVTTCFSVRFLIRLLSVMASPMSRMLPAAWFLLMNFSKASRVMTQYSEGSTASTEQTAAEGSKRLTSPSHSPG